MGPLRSTGNPARDKERDMGTEVLYIRDENGGFESADGAEIVEAAKAYLNRRFRRSNPVTSPQIARDYLAVTLGARDAEFFCILLLDSRSRVIDFVELFRGMIDGASVHPREVVKLVLGRNAASVILVHNHPSGVAEPSRADELITARLKDALNLVDIRTVDHLIVAGGGVASMAETGLL
jgi:DNA repair protein RadC